MGTGRTLRRAATAAVLVGGATALAAAYVLRRPLPRTRGRLALKGLRERVEIIRDRWGVPHIYAANEHDLFFAVGYAQAQDRLWQMEFNRRLASGTLAELVGEPALEVDRLVRRVGFRRVAQAEWPDVLEDERRALEAFSAGVNAYLQRGKLPLEFAVLRRRPRPWEPVDTLAYGHCFGWMLAGNWDTEILRSWTIERFGAAVMAELEPASPEGAPVIVPPGTAAKGVRIDLTEDFRQTEELAGLVGQAMSNNWAVDGQKSVTGKPLLASDPHLPLSMPSIWWEVHVDSPDLKAAGVGLPGMPGVFMGHNGRVAWGMTAAIVDGDDFFVEQVNPDNPSQYRYKGKWVDAEIVREEIKVRGRPRPVAEEIMITRHGPVVSPAIKGETRTLALKTVALERSQQVHAQLGLMAARDWDEFREALATWPMPSLNFGYADVDGNIGYHLAGRVPVRARGHGAVPSPGWSGDYEWTGFVPFDELPHAYNPPTHWVASANNQITDDDYPHFLSAAFADSYRQRRIIELLEAKEKLSADDFKAMQVDQLSLPARELVPLVLQVQPQDEWGQRALTFLRSWDYRVSADSVAACVYEVFFTHLVRRALEEKLGSWSDFFVGRGIHPVRRHGMFFNVAHSWLMEKVRERPAWFEGKTWHEIMEECLASAAGELRRLLGDEVSRWQWGRLHKQRFRHPLGEVRGLDRIFNRGPVPLGGDANTVWQASYAPYHSYDVTGSTATWRQIIDLADFNRSQAVLPNGQSGHPGSAHYHDMIPMWRQGEYHPMPWDREEVERYADRRLELVGSE
ncbi:MAG: penicillin acylase family protein [Dehalococcoidia bacterium]|nr:penicillin acylase family protein [Dehalococcoidia bacterium]